MQMREVAPAAGADSRDLLTSPHIFSGVDEDCIDVAVIRLHIFALSVFEIGVQYHDHVAPPRSAVTRQHDPSVSNGINWIAKIAVLAAYPIEVVTEMTIFRATLRDVSIQFVLV